MSSSNIPLPLWSRPREELWLLRSNICTKTQLEFEVALHAAETRHDNLDASLLGVMNVDMVPTAPMTTLDLAQGHVEELGLGGRRGLQWNYLEVVDIDKASGRNRDGGECGMCFWIVAAGFETPWTRKRF